MPILDQYGNPIPKEPPKPIRGALELSAPYRAYPARGLTPERLARILRMADDGDLSLQAELFEQMEEGDALLMSLLQTRKLAVVGLDWRLEPADTSREGKRIHGAVEEVWWNLPLEDVMTNLLSAIPQGVSVVAVGWEWDGLLWRPSGFRWVHPSLLLYKAEEDRFYLQGEDLQGRPFPYGGPSSIATGPAAGFPPGLGS